MYSINCITQWWQSWKRNGWRKHNGQPVSNLDLIQPILDRVDLVTQEQFDIKWQHVRAHSGIEGNEMADTLAKQGAVSDQTLVMSRI